MPPPSEARKEQNRQAAARLAERLRRMTPLERAAWKARTTLGEDYVVYTPDEERDLEDLKMRIVGLQHQADALNYRIKNRLVHTMDGDPRLAVLVAELDQGPAHRVDLKPF